MYLMYKNQTGRTFRFNVNELYALLTLYENI